MDGAVADCGKIHGFDHVVDDALKPHPGAVFGGIDFGDTIFLEFPDFFRNDHAAAAAKNPDMGSPVFFQKIDHVFEKFDMTALITGYADSLCIFGDGGIDDFLNGSVMAEVNNFHTGVLQNPSHDVDGCIMTVKKRGGGDHPDVVSWLIGLNRDTHASSFDGAVPDKASCPKINRV